MTETVSIHAREFAALRFFAFSVFKSIPRRDDT
jgi:hypothetical protein